MIKRIPQHDLARWLPPVRTVLLPLVQPDGEPLEPAVGPGRQVDRFELLARPVSDAGCELRAPHKARVLGRTTVTTSRHHGVPAVELRCEPQEVTPDAPKPKRGETPRDLESLCRLATECGLVDLSSGSPLARSLRDAHERGVPHLVVNSLDPLPEVRWHADLLYLAGRPIAAATGAVARALGTRAVTLAIDRAAVPRGSVPLAGVEGLRRVRLTNHYPLGHPRLLAQRLFGDRFPYDRPLTAGGVLVLDVETLFALAEAIEERQPFVWRWVFVGGDAIDRPGLYRVFLGSRLADLLADVGAVSHVSAVVVGGLLAGRAVEAPETIVTWDTTAVHFLTAGAFHEVDPSSCVRCGWCQESCPVRLDPREIYGLAEQLEPRTRKNLHPGACVECGLCSYVCPSRLDLMVGVVAAKRLCDLAEASAPRADAAA